MRAPTIARVAALAASIAAGAAAGNGQTTVARAIDPATSQATFSIEHIFVSRVHGTVPILEGTVTLPPGSSIPQSVTATLDASRLNTGDPDQSAGVRGPDYFDVAKYPTWSFTSTKIVASGPNAFSVDGTLTMHGVARPEHLDVTVSGNPAEPRYHAVGHVERHAFGMHGAVLDPAIGAVADISLDVNLK